MNQSSGRSIGSPLNQLISRLVGLQSSGPSIGRLVRRSVVGLIDRQSDRLVDG